MKNKIYNWLFNLSSNNGFDKIQSIAFAQNYVDDKIALNMIKEQYINVELKEKFENMCIKSFKLQKKLIFEKDDKLINFKSTYCCENIYNGNKKKCDLCNHSLKY